MNIGGALHNLYYYILVTIKYIVTLFVIKKHTYTLLSCLNFYYVKSFEFSLSIYYYEFFSVQNHIPVAPWVRIVTNLIYLFEFCLYSIWLYFKDKM